MSNKNERAAQTFFRYLAEYSANRPQHYFREPIASRIERFKREMEGAGTLESPIEVLAFGPLCLMGGLGIDVPQESWRDGVVYLDTQAKIGKFRVDFLFTMAGSSPLKRLVVECDGHEFHERTKEQAERDKSRDRELQQAGYAVMRFTGSEIHRWPEVVMCEVGNFFGLTGGENVEA